MASARSRGAGDGRRRAAVKRRIGQLTMTEVKRPSVALRASAAVELGTGTALIAVPGVVMDALIGSSPSAAELVARVLGGALLSLGIAGALEDEHSPDTGVTLGFIVYNASTAAILAAAGAAGSADGALLWPVVAIHAVAAVTLAVGWLRPRAPRRGAR
jgi:hypothetical protein